MNRFNLLVGLFIVSLVVMAGSFYLFKAYSPKQVSVKGAVSKNDYLMPTNATFISMGKNKEGRDVLSFNTNLSRDQVIKFYEELLRLRLPVSKTCISSIDFNDDSDNNRLVKVTFCN